MSDRTPVLFLSHGAPPLADDPIWPGELAAWSARIERPRNILMVSAHWEDAPITLSSTTGAELTYDFWGFPEHYYQVRYDAPPATELAAEVSSLIGGRADAVRRDEQRGLDHGGYVPLVEMFPAADIPVVQLSMPTLDPATLLGLGRTLAPLRDSGTLIVGSGFTTHNLSAIRGGMSSESEVPGWSREFDHWAAESLAAGDVDAIVDFAHRAPAPQIAHPRTEHWAPIFVALGAALGADGASPSATTEVDGFWAGLSKRSWQFD